MRNIIKLILIAAFILPFTSKGLFAATRDDVIESMYFIKASALVAPSSNQMNSAMEAKERADMLAMHDNTLREQWMERACAENADFRQVKKYLPLFRLGKTTEKDILKAFGQPRQAYDPSMPWMDNSCWIKDRLYWGSYPEPKEGQRILAYRYYYTEYFPPRLGLHLDIFITVDKKSGKMQGFDYFCDAGRVLDYWLVNMASN